jgi:hypothetical protein
MSATERVVTMAQDEGMDLETLRLPGPSMFEFVVVNYGRWLMWKRPGRPIEYAADLTAAEREWLDQQSPEKGVCDFSTFPAHEDRG